MAATKQPPPPETVKDQVDDQVPKRITALRFGVFSPQAIVNQSMLEVCERSLFDLNRDRAPRPNGPLDRRMGTPRRFEQCATCAIPEYECSGHFGHVRLALPAFHCGYLRAITIWLSQICKECSSILLPESERRAFQREFCRPNVDSLRKSQICRKVLERCKKTRFCDACGAINGAVRKVGALKIVHEKFRAFTTPTAAKRPPPRSKVLFDQSFSEAKKNNTEVEKHVKKAADDLNPLRVLKLFQRVSTIDCELLGLDPKIARPEMFIWQYVPAPPVTIRPSVAQDNASTEDDITSKLSDIIHISTLIREGLKKGSPTNQILEQWDFLQLQIAIYINSEIPGLQQPGYSKSIRGFVQRLKGKQGRFRGNLSGKRVNFSGRTVISPDPNLSIEEVAVPELVARTLTYPEVVNQYNIARLRQRVANGTRKHPGAVYIILPSKAKISLKWKDVDPKKYVRIGNIVERHLEDGDIVLFNRQPSLHKLSIMCHKVKVRPHRTFRLNECVCTPYNADFDGDEMNLHVPQTEEARAEALQLMGVKSNLCTPKNGEPIISAIQDFITCSYLLSSKDQFFDRRAFCNICMLMFNAEEHVDLPPPTILKPVALWTGKQVFNVLMRPTKSSETKVDLDAPGRQFKAIKGQPNDLDENDAWLCIRNAEIMCGRLDKAAVGAGKKSSIFFVILRDNEPKDAVAAMNRLARLSARWLSEQGFSIGINDVFAGEKLTKSKNQLIEAAYAKCDELISRYQHGRLQKQAGCDEEMTLENEITGVLNKVRGAAGDRCIEELSRFNSPLIMAKSGAKGSSLNVSQMVAVVGQQIISGKRVEDGFQDRSLPHFPKHARQPPSKGFVRNGFYEGLTPSEFIFHAMSGREGLVDTAVKTAETGYMSRRLMKSLEDLSTRYDDTVRSSASSIIQFNYGDDMLDPAAMEDKARPVNFDRAYLQATSETWNHEDEGLLPFQAIRLCKDLLKEKLKDPRKKTPTSLEQNKSSDPPYRESADRLARRREFMMSIAIFIESRIKSQVKLREKLGLLTYLDDRYKALGDLVPEEIPNLSTYLSNTDIGQPSYAINKNEFHRKDSAKHSETRASISLTNKLSQSTLEKFIEISLDKYRQAQVEPGHAVGAVGAQSLGEPGTQMTLKTFHFAGVAGMSITEGVPRIKEIINASKSISTPVITCSLEVKNDVVAARAVKGRIEKTYFKDIVTSITERWSRRGCVIELQLDEPTIEALELHVNMHTIYNSLSNVKKLKLDEQDITYIAATRLKPPRVRIRVQEPDSNSSSATSKAASLSKSRTTGPTDLHERAAQLSRMIPEIPIAGYPECNRAVITHDASADVHRVLVEGYGLRAVLGTTGVDFKNTKTNSIMETRDVLGIEAARSCIVDEMALVLRDMDIDPRHLALLADVMTQKGEVLGITRFGLARMRDSVLQLASFEKTSDHLFDAATKGAVDRVEGVSECVIMGQSMAMGTGGFGVVRALAVTKQDLAPKPTVFEDTYRRTKASQDASRKSRDAPMTENANNGAHEDY